MSGWKTAVALEADNIDIRESASATFSIRPITLITGSYRDTTESFPDSGMVPNEPTALSKRSIATGGTESASTPDNPDPEQPHNETYIIVKNREKNPFITIDFIAKFTQFFIIFPI